MDTVKQAQILTSFHEVREDLDLFVTASSIAELVDSISEESEPNERLFDLLLLGLQLLKEYPGRAALTLAVFQFKVMADAGLELMVTGCAACGGEVTDDAWFSLGLGGLVCPQCRSARSAGSGKVIRISPAAAGRLRWMSSHRLGEWPPSTDETDDAEVRALMSKVLEHWMEREFKSHRVARAIPRGVETDAFGG
jgi:DNA repair protein RecO (recombination protein O)